MLPFTERRLSTIAFLTPKMYSEGNASISIMELPLKPATAQLHLFRTYRGMAEHLRCKREG